MRSGNLIERTMKKIVKPNFFLKKKQKSSLSYKTCDLDHLIGNIKYGKTTKSDSQQTKY
jgi:hypothetical protein